MESKVKREKIVFTTFAKIVPYQIKIESIDNRKPPEPDILCELDDNTKMYFELTESIPETIAQTNSQIFRLPQKIMNRLHLLDDTKRKNLIGKYEDATIHIAYKKGLSENKKLNASTSIFDFLLTLENNAKGFFYPDKSTAVKWVSISRNRSKFSFEVEGAGGYKDPTLDQISKKFEKYPTDKKFNYPIELVLFYKIDFPIIDELWINKFADFCKSQIHISAIERVWIFSLGDNKIISVYPKV